MRPSSWHYLLPWDRAIVINCCDETAQLTLPAVMIPRNCHYLLPWDRAIDITWCHETAQLSLPAAMRPRNCHYLLPFVREFFMSCVRHNPSNLSDIFRSIYSLILKFHLRRVLPSGLFQPDIPNQSMLAFTTHCPTQSAPIILWLLYYLPLEGGT
jgi:hypothetical protein